MRSLYGVFFVLSKRGAAEAAENRSSTRDESRWFPRAKALTSMITRRLFAKALASLALIPTLIAPGRAAKPGPTHKSKLLLLSRGGTVLAEIDLVSEDVGGSHAVRGDGEIIASGIATRYAWRLPNGETLSGNVEDMFNPDCRFKFNTYRLVAGGRVAIAGDGRPMA